MDEKEILKNIVSILETQEDMRDALLGIAYYCEYFIKEPAKVAALKPKEKQKKRRRNNPSEMTVTEQIAQVKEQICDRFRRYRTDKLINQETLDEICEHNCPLRKL